MHDIHIPGSPSTPDIHGDAAAGVLAIRGDSYPENSFELFSPVIDWVRGILAGEARPLALDLGLVYLNTSSVKAMMDIFDLLEEAHGRGRPVAVRWTYDPRNGQIAELAEEFREDCTFPFEIVPR